MPQSDSHRPVCGVSFADYCAVTTDVSQMSMRAGGQVGDPNVFQQAAKARGIDPGIWGRAQLVWGARLALDPQLTAALSTAIAAAFGYPMPGGSAALTPAPPAVDLGDPNLAPIDGVPIESYVRYISATLVSPSPTEEECMRAAVASGLPADRWMSIAEQWGTRVLAGHPVSTRYYELVTQIMG